MATKQTGEPNHAGDPGGHSVWYSWTPSKSAAVELDVCAAGFDPVLGVYTGSALGGLTAVATSDAGAGQCDEGSSFGFEAVAGTTYRVAVDGTAGDDGYFELDLRPAIEHPRSLSVSSAGAGSVHLGRGRCRLCLALQLRLRSRRKRHPQRLAGAGLELHRLVGDARGPAPARSR